LIANLGSNFRSSGDLVFDSANNRFFAISDEFGSDALYSVGFNTQTNSVTSVARIGSIGFDNVWGVSLQQGVLRGYTSGDQEIVINPFTGAGTLSRGIPRLSGSISGASGLNNDNNAPPFVIQRWETKRGAFWDTQQWVVGDFNGDGTDDLAKAFSDNGLASIDAHISTGSSFAMQRWQTRGGGFWDAQKWLVGDFNGDGRDDMVKAFNDGGLASIDTHVSNGSSFAIQRWETQRGGFWDAQKWLVGDFNGDGRDDLAKAFNDGGLASIDTHVSNGSSFAIQRWETQRGGFWDAQKWLVGDFNGDGRDDLIKVFNDGGLASIDVHISTGSSFNIQRWGTQQGGFWDAQKWVVGDFNGDGRDDMAKAFSDNGLASIDVHISTGSSFNIQRWGTQQGGFWDAQKWLAGNFDGDNSDELAKVFSDSGLASIDVHR
jgi:hypothetical protein